MIGNKDYSLNFLCMKSELMQEMTVAEMQEVSGGIGFLAACAIATAVLYIVGTCCALSQGSNPHTGGKM